MTKPTAVPTSAPSIPASVPPSGNPVPSIADLMQSMQTAMPALGKLTKDEVRRVSTAIVYMWTGFDRSEIEHVCRVKFSASLEDVLAAGHSLFEISKNQERLLTIEIAEITGRTVPAPHAVEAVDVINAHTKDELTEQALAKSNVEDARARKSGAETSWKAYLSSKTPVATPEVVPTTPLVPVADWRAQMVAALNRFVYNDVKVDGTVSNVMPDWKTIRVFDPKRDEASMKLMEQLGVIESAIDKFEDPKDSFELLAQIGFDDAWLEEYFNSFTALLDRQLAQSLGIDDLATKQSEAWLVRARNIDSIQATLTSLFKFLG